MSLIILRNLLELVPAFPYVIYRVSTFVPEDSLGRGELVNTGGDAHRVEPWLRFSDGKQSELKVPLLNKRALSLEFRWNSCLECDQPRPFFSAGIKRERSRPRAE